MEFLGAKYYFRKRDNVFICKRYIIPQCRGYKTPYNLFYIEISPQIRKSGSRSDILINSLVSKAWKNLPAERRDYYDRKAKEIEPNQRMNERCSGQLKFKARRGQRVISADELIGYVEHSAESSIETDESELISLRVVDLDKLTNFFSIAAVNFMRRITALKR